MIQYLNMRLLVMTLGCCAVALVTSVALFNGLTLSHLNTQTFEANVIQTTTILPPVAEAASPEKATVTSIPTEKSSTTTFALPVTYKVGETHTYTDGLTVTLHAIDDARCKLNEICATSQKLASEFTTTQGVTIDTEKIILDFAKTTSVTTALYEYTLVNSTDTEATIIIKELSTTTPEATVSVAKTSPTIAPKAPQTVAVSKTLITPVLTKNKLAVPKSTETTMTKFEKALIEEIEKQTNEFRRAHKRDPFATDGDLAKNATSYSTHLLSNTYLSHTNIQGCDITCRFADNGYKAQAWGENLAVLSFNEQPSVEYVANFFMRQWEKSAGHRANLLSKAFTNQGVGVAFDQNKIYLVVQFANPS